jgi:hypothetical protein
LPKRACARLVERQLGDLFAEARVQILGEIDTPRGRILDLKLGAHLDALDARHDRTFMVG